MIPRKVMINGRTYNVRRLSKSRMPTGENKTGEDEELLGYCDPAKTEILVAKELSKEAAQGTYEHEVGHASAEESGARDIMEKFTNKSEELEEHLIRVWLPVYLASLRSTRKKA